MLHFVALVPAISAYPLAHTNCGVTQTINDAPEAIVTMNQGATEFMLGLGLASKMVGTAYIDDTIWPRYATEYAEIPVLAEAYPDQATLMNANPDFIVGSYNSAFRQTYVDDRGRDKGIFLEAGPIGPCTGPGSDYGQNWTTCRPQLHANGIGTYLFSDACEDPDMRPADGVTEEMVYAEVRKMASIFDVDAEALITNMQADFDGAAAFVSRVSGTQPFKTAWIDCVGRRCPEGEIFVGAGGGAPQMLMAEAGLTNVFAGEEGNWKCVADSRLVEENPDVLVLVHAAWDTAIDKAIWLYNHSDLCELSALTSASFVHIPFSATTLGPRNGPAAFDLAIAASHVRSGSLMGSHKSGVGSFNPNTLEQNTRNLQCTVQTSSVQYDADASLITDAEVNATCPSGVLEVCYSCSSSNFVGDRGNCPGFDADGCSSVSLHLLIWFLVVVVAS